MSLVELEKDLKLITDKNTCHSYLPLYDELLCRKKFTCRRMLEVGICWGGSIELWNKYFPNAMVYAMDILPEPKLPDLLKSENKIRMISGDAYSPYLSRAIFSGKKFDFVIDDGSHTLHHQLNFLTMYSKLLEDDGILIIEDIQDIHYLEILKENTPDDLKPYIKTFDLRKNKGRYDDICFVLDKSQSTNIYDS
jgi:cephalosporin hydroxylase